MVNHSQLRRIACTVSLLCAMTLAFGGSHGISVLREIRGTVQVGAQLIRDAAVTIVDAKEATVRYESRLKASKSNIAVLSDELRIISARTESMEKDRTAKVYKTMFPEVGPADKEQLRQEINVLNAALTALNSDEAALRGKVLAWRSPDGFFQGRWTNVLAVTRTTDRGEFSVQIPKDRNCWLAIPGKAQTSAAYAHSWLMPIPPNNSPLILCETNAIFIGL